MMIDITFDFGEKRALRIAIGILIMALLSGNGAIAATITVSDNYTRIQWAIDNAITGDTIEVYSGTYYENVNVNKKLTLKGIGMPVVDARGSGSAITLAVNGITLVGFTAIGSGSDSAAGIKVISNNNTLIGNNASNNEVSKYGDGIYLYYSSNNTLIGNNASKNRYGFYLHSSDNNRIISNTANSNKKYGIYLYSSKNSTISGNNANLNDHYGIFLYFSSNNNMLIGNNASNNDDYGILVHSSSNNNTVSGNNALDNYDIGIGLWYSSNNNTLIANNASNNHAGIYLAYSSNNMVSGNNASNNDIYGFGLASSSNNTLINNNASKNDYGIDLTSSSNNTLSSNKVRSNNVIGILLRDSSNNSLSGNYVSLNKGTGISVRSSSNNKIYHNNIINNTNQAEDDMSTNSWDSGYPDGGNYWDSYTGIDQKSGPSQNIPGSDGIGDSPFYIEGSAGAKDMYPYMNENGWVKSVDLLPVVNCGPDKFKCENAGTKVQFKGTASNDPDGTIFSYDWQFGDGTTGTGAAPNHTYAAYRWNGSAYQPFIINLTVTVNEGLANHTSQKVVIWMVGDSNGDGKVDILDASVVGLKWNGNDSCADLNNDGKVDILDASIIGLNWGKPAIIGG